MAGMILAICGMAEAGSIAGTWTKTTHPDPSNIILLYSDSEIVKATGYEQVGDMPAYWYGEGIIRNGKLDLSYHYSAEATPKGWEPEGRMVLTLSENGNTLRGTATSRSGGWSERIELRRISFVMQR
ncbi:MAG: hypothetical protein C4519_26970 [Desulfobacteraceae bacterium]|nr:MAG: hypothetical protein C4519_26970 [Desulfobacteraceae bacterium]